MFDRLIDRIDTFCYDHIWVPVWVRVWVGRLWQRRFNHRTWTAVGDDD